jgi:hypothetical protein
MSTRGRKPSKTEERKSRVIQTRVPQDLEDTLKDAAEQKRMTVSHYIRHVLEDTFSLVDGIVQDSSTLMENASRDAKRLAARAKGEAPTEEEVKEALMEQVDAWQDVIVNKPSTCLGCDTELKRGKKAFRGIGQTEEVLWLCQECIESF